MPVTSPADTLAVSVLTSTDGVWRTYGREAHDLGILPEGFTFTSKLPGGADTAQFTLKRSLSRTWPDLNPLDAVEVTIGGIRVFKGRIRETPAVADDTRAITVVCEGLAYALNDYVLDRPYVRTDLGLWKDMRQYNGVSAGFSVPTGRVQTGTKRNGAIYVAHNIGTTLAINDGVGVMIDLGPNPSAYPARIEIQFDGPGAPDTSCSMFVTTADALGSGGSMAPSGANRDRSGGTVLANAGWKAYTFAVDQDGQARSGRYISVTLESTVSHAATVNSWVRFININLYYRTSYVSANVPVLKASDVIKDALGQVPELSAALTTDTPKGYITPTTYNLPEFDTQGYKSIQDIIVAANAYHGNDWWVDNIGVFHYVPAPVYGKFTPTWQTALSRGARLAIGGSSAADIYNTVLVQAGGADGTVVRCTSKPKVNPTWSADANAPQVSNPGFEVNTAGWTATTGTLTRDTVNFHSGVASGAVAGVGSATDIYIPLTVKEGESYMVEVWFKAGAQFTSGALSVRNFKVTADLASQALAAGGFSRYSVIFTADMSGPVRIRLTGATSTATGAWGNVDDVKVYRNATGLLGRKAKTRMAVLSINAKLAQADAQQIGDAYLANVATYPPFKGQLTVGGYVVTDAQSNEPIPVYRIQPGDIIQVNDIPDPNRNGAMGRMGKVVGVTYDHTSKTATLDLDNSRDWVFALSQRLRSNVTGP
jgi:hypothetical protein